MDKDKKDFIYFTFIILSTCAIMGYIIVGGIKETNEIKKSKSHKITHYSGNGALVYFVNNPIIKNQSVILEDGTILIGNLRIEKLKEETE